MTRDDDATGCGIKPLITGKQDPFFTACEWHDQAYVNQSWAQKNLERKIVDLQFLKQMLEIAGDDFWLRQKAWLYYRLARIFGCRFWEGK